MRTLIPFRTAALVAAAVGSACTDRSGPPEPAAGMIVVQPSFAPTAMAGIVPLAEARLVLTRVPGGQVAKDTVVALAAGQDSVDLRLSVSLLGPVNTFLLTIALITPDGDTAFRAGPVEVQAGTGVAPPVISVTFVYTGVGANAELVTITSTGLTLAVGQSLTLQAAAFDGAGAVIPNTPVGWRSLDPAVAAVPAPEAGTVVGVTPGSARIVAQLLTGPADTVSVTVTASAIVFAGDSSGGLSTGVFRVNRDGSARTRIYPMASLGGYQWINPRWAPDRSRVAFGLESAASGIIMLEVVSPDGLQTAHVVSDASVRYPRWSPNGVHLAFACGSTSLSYNQWDVCVINDATGTVPSLAGRGDSLGRIALTALIGRTRASGMPAFGWDPTNPDRIAVVRDSAGALTSSRIFVATFTGGTWTVAPLSPDVMDAGTGPLTVAGDWLDWSPDGLHIVFSAYDPQYSWHIYRINRDGTGLVALTSGTTYDDAPLYSPDGSEILFWRDANCSLDAWIMNADGSNQHQVTAENVCDFQTWLLGYDWSPDGQEIVLTGFDTVGNLLIYKVPRTTTAATYLANRVLVGRGVDPGGFVRDIQPSWRP
jgi:Tol biopolymer transport system component